VLFSTHQCPRRISNRATAPNSTSHPEFTRSQSNTTNATTARMAVSASTMDALPNCHETTAMSARDPALTPSRNAPAVFDFLIRGANGPLTATSTKAGRKMPAVATTAPRKAAQQIAYKCGGREHRPWRDLSDGNGIEHPEGEILPSKQNEES